MYMLASHNVLSISGYAVLAFIISNFVFVIYSSTEKHFNEDSLLIIDDFRTELINYDEGGDGRC